MRFIFTMIILMAASRSWGLSSGVSFSTSPVIIRCLNASGTGFESCGSGDITDIPAANITAGSLGTGVVASSVAVSGVVPGTYGDATTNNRFTVGGDGRILSVSSVAIAGGAAPEVRQSSGSTTLFMTSSVDGVIMYATTTITTADNNVLIMGGFTVRSSTNASGSNICVLSLRRSAESGLCTTSSTLINRQFGFLQSNSHSTFTTVLSQLNGASGPGAGTWTYCVSANCDSVGNFRAQVLDRAMTLMQVSSTSTTGQTP